MPAPVAAAVVADIATKNPKLVSGTLIGGAILVVLILGGVGFAYFKIAQKIGLIDDKNDRLAAERMKYLAKWQGLNPTYNQKFFSGQNTLQKQPISYAKELKDSWGVFNDNESKALATLESIGSAQNLSAVAFAYNASFGKSLRDDIQNYLSNNEEQDLLIRIVRNYSDFKQSDKRTV